MSNDIVGLLLAIVAGFVVALAGDFAQGLLPCLPTPCSLP